MGLIPGMAVPHARAIVKIATATNMTATADQAATIKENPIAGKTVATTSETATMTAETIATTIAITSLSIIAQTSKIAKCIALASTHGKCVVQT